MSMTPASDAPCRAARRPLPLPEFVSDVVFILSARSVSLGGGAAQSTQPVSMPSRRPTRAAAMPPPPVPIRRPRGHAQALVHLNTPPAARHRLGQSLPFTSASKAREIKPGGSLLFADRCRARASNSRFSGMTALDIRSQWERRLSRSRSPALACRQERVTGTPHGWTSWRLMKSTASSSSSILSGSTAVPWASTRSVISRRR